MSGHLNTLKHLVVLALLGSVLLLTGCGMYMAPVMPPQGGLITTFKAPLTVNFNDTPVSGDLKHSSKKKTQYLFVPLFGPDFAWGEVDVPKIARAAGITKVSYADYERLYINIPLLFVYAEFTVHVYGK